MTEAICIQIKPSQQVTLILYCRQKGWHNHRKRGQFQKFNRFKQFRAALQTEKNKVSLVQSAQTDVLYIACHSILREYWGVA